MEYFLFLGFLIFSLLHFTNGQEELEITNGTCYLTGYPKNIVIFLIIN
jgi:hypothetical protein